MLVGQGAGHDTPPRVVGRAWHGPPPDVVGDPLPLHCGQSYDYWEKKRFVFNTAPLLSTLKPGWRHRHNSWQGGIKVRKESLYFYNWHERWRCRRSTGNDVREGSIQYLKSQKISFYWLWFQRIFNGGATVFQGSLIFLKCFREVLRVLQGSFVYHGSHRKYSTSWNILSSSELLGKLIIFSIWYLS